MNLLLTRPLKACGAMLAIAIAMLVPAAPALAH